MSNWLKMAEAQPILALARLGWSYRRIAREVGVDRETVSRHVKADKAGGSNAAISITGSADADGGVEPAGSVGEGGVGVGDHRAGGVSSAAISIAGNSAAEAGRRSSSEPWREPIQRGVEQGLSARRIWQDLTADPACTVGYQSVQRFVRKLGESLPLPVRRMEVEAGQEAQVDFGRGVAGGRAGWKAAEHLGVPDRAEPQPQGVRRGGVPADHR